VELIKRCAISHEVVHEIHQLPRSQGPLWVVVDNLHHPQSTNPDRTRDHHRDRKISPLQTELERQIRRELRSTPSYFAHLGTGGGSSGMKIGGELFATDRHGGCATRWHDAMMAGDVVGGNRRPTCLGW